MRVIGDSVFLDQIGNLEYIHFDLIVVPHLHIVWDHRLHLVDFGSHISRDMKKVVASLHICDYLGISKNIN